MVLRPRSLLLPGILGLALALLALAASPAPAIAGGAACGKWGNADPVDLSKREARKAILCLLNRERAQAKLPALDRSKKLQRAAQKHSARMRGTGCFDHRCPREGSLQGRLRSTRYLRGDLKRWRYGENIAWGGEWRGSPKSIVAAWMQSPPHRANILTRGFRDVGIGFVKGTPPSKGANGGIFTTDFGFRRG